MKFCKKYEEYMQVQPQREKIPRVGFKKLKKILKRCRRDVESTGDTNNGVLLDHHSGDDAATQSSSCPVCDGTFFPSLLKEMSEVVGFFNEHAQRLLELHLSSGFQKCFIWLKEKLPGHHVSLFQEGKDLVNYALINATAMRKILKKYDKIHYSKQGQVFKSQAHTMHIEILQSPWLCELMAFHINMRATEANTLKKAPVLFEGCALTCKDGKPSLSCELFDSVKLEIDLTCSICLDTVFDPVSLACGHIFCYMCACKAASVTIVDGLKAASPNGKCPLCREEDVFYGTVHMEELNILLSKSCSEYWKERIQAERIERVKQAKEHWESQCRAFMGI